MFRPRLPVALLLALLSFTPIHAQQCFTQLDLAFVVDSSGSIEDAREGNWNLILNFIRNIVNNFNRVDCEDVRVGLVTFSNNGNLIFDLNRACEPGVTKNIILDDILRTNYGGGNTHTAAGFIKANTEIFVESAGDRPGVPNTIILITDGKSTINEDRTIPEADNLKNRGIQIMGIGITENVNMEELRAMSSDGQTYFVNDFDQLTDILDQLKTETCVTLPPSTTPALPPSPDCPNPVDLVIALDGSGSVEADNYNKMKDWTKLLIQNLPIEEDVARVGVLSFSRTANVIFHLNEHTDRLSAINEVEGMEYPALETNTHLAISTVRDSMFTSTHGARSNTERVLLLITDGNSNNRESTLAEAREAKKQGIHIMVVIVGDWVQMDEINGMASYPFRQNVRALNNFGELNSGFQETIRRLMCNIDNECNSNPCSNGLQCVNKINSFSCVCSERWGGATCNQRCENRADIVFALDASSSIGKANFQTMIQFVRDTIEGLRIGRFDSSRPSRVGLLVFANNAEVIFHLDAYDNKYDILNAFPPYYRQGTTNTADALKIMREQMFVSPHTQVNVRRIGVIITDGRSNDEARTWQEAMETRRAGIDLISIGVGQSVRLSELKAIASFPNEVDQNVLRVNTFSQLQSKIPDLTATLCNNVNECNNGPCRNGGRCTDMLNGYVCRCTQTWTGITCENRCSGNSDVVFAIDTSGSIRRERFGIVLDFVKATVNQFEMGSDKETRVGVVSYSDDASVDFHLDTYTTKQDVIQAIDYIQYRGERTHTASAIKIAHEQMFTAANGDRSAAPNHLYIVSDGNSNVQQDETIPEAVASKLAGIHVMTVSVGTQTNLIELKGMASSNAQDNMYRVESFDNLMGLMPQMPKAVCDEQNECNSGPCRNGGQCVNLLNGYRCDCPDGRTGITCQFSCRVQVDIVFVLDLSGSTEAQYDNAVAFTKAVVHNLDFNFGRTRVGVITYGDDAQMQFQLRTYTTKEEVLTALAFRPNGGRTNTQSALQMLRNDGFRSTAGNRDGVPDKAVVISDGGSNIIRDNTIPEADRVKNQNIDLYVVAIGDSVDMNEMNEMAGTNGQNSNVGYVYQVNSANDIDRLADQLSEHICNQ